MAQWRDDAELVELIESRLRTALLCDAMDDLGHLDQAMESDIEPMDPRLDQVIAGRAATALFVDVHHTKENPYEVEIGYVDGLKPRDIAVVATNRSRSNGIWGELMSTAAKLRGARGAVTDGLCRDKRLIVELGFPVFCPGTAPLDSAPRGLMIEHGKPVTCGGVRVSPGDLVVMDIDGICVVPRAVEKQAVTAALDKASRESATKKELLTGALLRDVYSKYGVL
jgi:regulator of RNase E activity RraA